MRWVRGSSTTGGKRYVDEFLASLSPSVRAQVDRALEAPDGQRRLQLLVSPYLDAEGRWPRDVATNDYIARRFVRQMGVVAPVGMGVSYAGSGLRSATLSSLAGGVTSVAAGKGAVVLQTRLLERYWSDMIAYTLGMQPDTLRALRGVVETVTKRADWGFLGLRLQDGYDHEAWSQLTGDYAADLTSAMLGNLARSAWRGMRSALLHTTGVRIGDVSDNEIIENYVRNFVEGQTNLSERTARLIATNATDKGLGPRITAERLKQMWALSPRHAQAVENYRAGLGREERPQGIINRMAGDYAARLVDSRLKAIANTETSTAFNVAREAQWLKMVQTGDMPVGTLKMWVTAKDELVCPVCRPMDGVTAPLGQTFEQIHLMVPTAHPNCRCIIIPVHDVPEFDKTKLIFPLEKISKHLGGSDGKEDHPSGTSQDVHSGGSERDQEDPGFSPKWTNTDLADDWVRFTTEELRRGETEVHRAFLNDIITAQQVPNLYRGINFDLEETSFSQRDLKKNLKRWTNVGKTFNLPLSSFTANITDGFGYAMRGEEPGVMFWVEDARAIRVNAKKSDEYKDDAFVEVVNKRNEHVTRGKFKVNAVEEGPRGVTIVKIEQIDIPEVKNPIKGKLSKSESLEEALVRLLSTSLPKDEVSKHLIGRHDQKTHGRKGHSSPGGFELSGVGESLSNEEKTVLFATAGVASAVLFRQAAPLTSVKALANPVQALRRNGQYLKGMSEWVNKGSLNFRMFLEGRRRGPDQTRMYTAFADGLDQLAKHRTPLKIHRGMTVPASHAERSRIHPSTLTGTDLRAGQSFDIAPVSFTRSRLVANEFRKLGPMKHGIQRIVIHVDRGSNTARIADVSRMPWEREYVGWGTFTINRVSKNRRGYTDVYVTQTKTYSLGDIARNPPQFPGS